jgi:hypothetical protein
MGVKEMDLDVSAVLLPGKFFLTKLGFWFESCTNMGRRKRIMRIVIIFNVFLFIVMNMSSILAAREKSLVESTFEILFLLRQISVFQKILTFRFRVREISELFSNAFDKISMPDLVDDAFEKYRNKCKKKPKLIIAVLVISYITALTWIISIVAMAYLSGSKSTASSVLDGATIMPIWLPFDINEYPLLQKCLLVYQILGVQPVAITMMGFFAFYSGALILSHEMFKHFNDVLILLHKPLNRDPPFDSGLYVRQNKEVKDIIKYAVQHHIRSLKYY